MTQTIPDSPAASRARSTTHDLSLLLADIPFQICFVLLATIIGPLYLFVWTLDILPVALLNKIYCGLQATCLEATDIAESMDRFTRTKEHYLRGRYRRESRQPETPAAPPAADLTFDFDSKDSTLDLSFDIEKPFVKDEFTTKTTNQIEPSDDIGVALSDGPSCKERAQLKCSRIKEEQNQCVPQPNEWISPVPEVPSEIHVRFSVRGEQPSRNLPPCSIYSREWRQRVRRIIAPPEQTAEYISAEDAVDMSERNSTNVMGSTELPDPENGDGADKEPSLLPKPSLKSANKAAEEQPLHSSSPPESITKSSRKRLSTIGKWLLRPKTLWGKRASISITNPSVQRMLSNTPTSSSKSFQDATNQNQNQRIGGAFRARVSPKQAEAQDQFFLGRHPTESLRGGGNFDSVNTSHQWGNDHDAFNRHRRGPHRRQSSENSLTHIQIQRRPSRRTRGFDDRGVQRPEQSAQKPSNRKPKRLTQEPGDPGSTRTSPSTLANQAEDTPPHGLLDETQSSHTPLSHRPSPICEPTQQSHSSSHHSDPSPPIAVCNEQPDTRDNSCQAPPQAGPSLPQQRIPSTHRTSIRISVSDGRVLSTAEYKALPEKRAGMKAITLQDRDENQNKSVNGVESKVEGPRHERRPASRGGTRLDKSTFAGPFPKELQTPGAPQLEAKTEKTTPEGGASRLQKGVAGVKAQSRKPVLWKSTTGRPPVAADTKAHSAGPLLPTDHGKEEANINVKSNEHSTAITGPSSQHPAAVPSSSTRQQHSTTAQTSSQQSLTASASNRRNAAAAGSAAEQPTTIPVGEASVVGPSPVSSLSKRQGTGSRQDATTGESSRLRSYSDDENARRK
ncbi:uncharacterized protein Z519_01592 [Cladophialophora bantiana CBS 173.52]|uniref:Uncharacterized protein n=1 Tax=Cladophialophora bantiana (strain ATCC 10958 / CBS 173.52 / CDC B-1940 / NIH 8579) TaxID=1442370 RepID=A0A0D2HXB6_CLAB1|nr:uncharacterized protein Z519_01592 [Cladophialophora bantiana CBS 173.52]KIW98008.1 hypothetical protein Z519_01592 [Cladophialophora bantiana CBS 173.52]